MMYLKKGEEITNVFGTFVVQPKSVQDIETDYAKLKPKKVVELI